VLPNGDLFPGYVPPQQLAAMLSAPAAGTLAKGQDSGAVDAVP
jgi:hypothetical protein